MARAGALGLGDVGRDILGKRCPVGDRVDVALGADRIGRGNRGPHCFDRLQAVALPEELGDARPDRIDRSGLFGAADVFVVSAGLEGVVRADPRGQLMQAAEMSEFG